MASTQSSAASKLKLAAGLAATLLLGACASGGSRGATSPYEAAAEPTTRQTVCRIWGNADDASYCAPVAVRTEVSRRD